MPPKRDQNRAVVVLSGGLDSTTLLYNVLDLKYEVHTLSINYGQRHAERELTAAINVAMAADVVYPDQIQSCRTLDLHGIGELVPGSALTGGDPVPEGHYAEANMAATVVPNRNAIFLSVAAAHAMAHGAARVYIGVHAGDHAVYPDCRPEFIASYNTMLRETWGILGAPSIRAPFIDRTKAEIVSLGAQLHVPYEKTWSCYNGRTQHCGRCGTCVERQEAFDLANIVDPTEYEDATYWREAVATR